MALASAQLDRILADVGQQFIPDNLDRKELRSDLAWAATWHATGNQLRKGTATRRTKLETAAKTARKLKLLLADSEVSQDIGRTYPIREENPQRILCLLIDAVDRLLQPRPPEPAWAQKAAQQFASELAIHKTSSFEWLAGQHLPGLFHKHFERKATPRNSKGEPDTPYVRFARSVLDALAIRYRGKPYSPESIVKAMTTANQGRTRRQPVMGNPKKK